MRHTETDPFAEVPSGRAIAAVKQAEKGSYSENTGLAPAPAVNSGRLTLPTPETSGLFTGSYSRVEELADQPGFFKLEEIQALDLVILGIDPRQGNFGEYLTVEFQFANPQENPDPERGDGPYIVNVGGTIAVPRLLGAAKKIAAGKASGPLVACFTQETTAAGQMFWNVR